MTKIVQEEIANESKLVKVLLHLGTGGHCDRWMTAVACRRPQMPLFQALIFEMHSKEKTGFLIS